jgi:nitrite reductase/ring-hydroxylating ferredoxin subunit
LTDWSETDGRARREGLLHGLLNIAATALMAIAYMQRKSNGDARGRGCAWAGYGIAVASAYLGGDLVYGKRIGVTHAVTDEPEAYTDIAASSELQDGSMRRAHHEDTDALLVRTHGRVCALAHACAHLGGPLSEGTLKERSVVCPWHGSEFALDDGRVITGPATQPQPVFDVREQNGRIAVKQP